MADLQTQSGGKALVFTRVKSNESKDTGTKVAFQTTYSYKTSRDKKSEDTKDGSISKGGSSEGEFSLEMLSSNQDMLKQLRAADEKGETVEFWIVYTDTPGSTTGTYAARYMQAHTTSVEETGDSDNSVSIKVDATVDGAYAKTGDVKLNLSATGDAGYGFRGLEPVK